MRALNYKYDKLWLQIILFTKKGRICFLDLISYARHHKFDEGLGNIKPVEDAHWLRNI